MKEKTLNYQVHVFWLQTTLCSVSSISTGAGQPLCCWVQPDLSRKSQTLIDTPDNLLYNLEMMPFVTLCIRASHCVNFHIGCNFSP